LSELPFNLDNENQLIHPLVLSSPHSGREYTTDFINSSCLTAHELRSSEDAYVDLLFSGSAQKEVPLISAKAPRSFIDLNRAANEHDLAVISECPNVQITSKSAAGLGVIPRVVAHGKNIYRGKIPYEIAQKRIDEFYWPYHNKLQELLEDRKKKFRYALLLDCHSMPSNLTFKGNLNYPDIIIGDRFKMSTNPKLMDLCEQAFLNAGFSVQRNHPFAGGHITQHYGKPKNKIHAIQIELNRSLYLDETAVVQNSNFKNTKNMIDSALSDILKSLPFYRDDEII